jgi:hypothetical protein
VESYRTARGSRQRVVAYVGELQGREQNGWAQLGRRLDGRSRPQRTLFEPPHYDEPDEEETVEIIVTAMESKYGKAHRIRVMDRGMVSEDNLQFVRQRSGSYIVV